MGVFKNSVGRPSNEVLRKRKILKITGVMLVLAIAGFICYVLNNTGIINIMNKENSLKTISKFSASERQMGDMNGDNCLTVLDVALLYGYVRGNTTIINSEALKVADLSGNGNITVEDVAILYTKVRSLTANGSECKNNNSDNDNNDGTNTDEDKNNSSTLNCSSTPKSFETDSWDTIICAAKSGNTSAYRIGDEREIDMGSFGKHKVRLANKTTIDECKNDDFSQSACGFVIEFADIITKHEMDKRYSIVEERREGWSVTSMRTYINSEIYNLLPSDLRKGIINTRIISKLEVGSYDPNCDMTAQFCEGGTITNVSTNDKLYLLDTHEIYVDEDYSEPFIYKIYPTRRLDFYRKYIGDKYQNYNALIKKTTDTSHDEQEYWWWLRTGAHGYSYINVNNMGYNMSGGTAFSDAMRGVSPAFRLGE